MKVIMAIHFSSKAAGISKMRLLVWASAGLASPCCPLCRSSSIVVATESDRLDCLL